MQSGRKCVFGIGLNVSNVNDPTVYQSSASNRTSIHLYRRVAHVVGILRRIAVGCEPKKCLADLASNGSLVSIALARSCFNQRIKNRLQVKGGAADELEHIGGGGLLLKRFGKIPCSRLHLFKQPNVLDCDHCLVGEGFNKLDLLLVERLWRTTHYQNYSNRRSFSQKWHPQRSAKADYFLNLQISVFWVCQHVRNVDGFALQQYAAGNTATSRPH